MDGGEVLCLIERSEIAKIRMLHILKKNKPYLLPVIVGITLLLWIDRIINPVMVMSVFEQYPMPLYFLVMEVPGLSASIMTFVAFVLLLVQAYQLNKINARFHLIDDSTYLPAFLFLLMVSSCKEWMHLNPMLFANLFIISAYQPMFSTFRIERYINPFFIAGLFISIASMFYFPAIFLGFIVFYFLFITRSFYWREWVVAFIGLCTPYVVSLGIFYLHDNTWVLFDTIRKQMTLPVTIYDAEGNDYLLFTVVSIVLIITTFFLFRKVIKRIIIRQFHFVLLLLWVISSVLFVAINAVDTEVTYFMAIPFSFFLAHFIIKNKKEWVSYLLLIVFVLLVLINRFS